MRAFSPLSLALMGVSVLLAGGLGYAYYEARTALLSAKADLSEATTTVASLGASLKDAEAENDQLADALAAEKERNDEFEGQISKISGTVGRLDKLARTDPELLQKYSKIYFLNENYVPSELVKIPEEWTYGAQEEYFHGKLWDDLRMLLEDAKDEGHELRIISGYRSFGTQALLKSSYAVRYGSGANAFSADQGYSEHQLGTTVDFTTEALGASFSSFDDTEAFKWLLENADEYGFVLSYPEGNAYYVYEPWHWRYVGRKLADDLADGDLHFYDLDQRELDEYLIDFFD